MEGGEPASGTHPGVARGERGVRLGPPRAAPAGGGSSVPPQPGAASGAVSERRGRGCRGPGGRTRDGGGAGGLRGARAGAGGA